MVKIDPFRKYYGNAITRQYKRAKHLTYLGGVATGTTLGFSSLFYSVGRNPEAFGLGGLGLVFLKDTVDVYLSLFKIAKPYDEICKRAAKIFKHK